MNTSPLKHLLETRSKTGEEFCVCSGKKCRSDTPETVLQREKRGCVIDEHDRQPRQNAEFLSLPAIKSPLSGNLD
jgi:hypothetical protein